MALEHLSYHPAIDQAVTLIVCALILLDIVQNVHNILVVGARDRLLEFVQVFIADNLLDLTVSFPCFTASFSFSFSFMIILFAFCVLFGIIGSITAGAAVIVTARIAVIIITRVRRTTVSIITRIQPSQYLVIWC